VSGPQLREGGPGRSGQELLRSRWPAGGLFRSAKSIADATASGRRDLSVEG